jgi:hypothetical protein
LKQWPKLVDAAKEKVAEIAAFVTNWDKEVRTAGRQPKIPRGRFLTGEQAEAAWGISQHADDDVHGRASHKQNTRPCIPCGSGGLAVGQREVDVGKGVILMDTLAQNTKGSGRNRRIARKESNEIQLRKERIRLG